MPLTARPCFKSSYVDRLVAWHVAWLRTSFVALQAVP